MRIYVVLICVALAACGGGGSSSSTNTATLTGSCVSLTCSFVATDSGAASSYAWDFGDSSAPVTTTTGKESHTYAKAGSYHVQVSITAGAEVNVGNLTVTATTPPVVAAFTESCDFYSCSFNAASTKINDGSAVKTYAWEFGDGTGASGETPSTVYTSGGSMTVTLTVTDTKGATGTTDQVLDVGNLGVHALGIATSIQVGLSLDAYSKVLYGINSFSLAKVQTYGARTNSGGQGPTYNCPGGGEISYFVWTDSNSDGLVDDTESYELTAPTNCAYASGAPELEQAGNAESTLSGDISGVTIYQINTDGTLEAGTDGNFLNVEYGWLSTDLNEVIVSSSGTLTASMIDKHGSTPGFEDDDGAFVLNPYGSDFPANQGTHPLDDQDRVGVLADSAYQSTCVTEISSFCSALTTDASDTQAINPNLEWVFEGSADGTVTAPSPNVYQIATTTPWYVGTKAGSLYMKSGAFTVTAYATAADYKTGTVIWTETVTATTDGSGNPAFSVSVSGGPPVVIPQSNWVSYPHVCGTDEVGYGCTTAVQ